MDVRDVTRPRPAPPTDNAGLAWAVVAVMLAGCGDGADGGVDADSGAAGAAAERDDSALPYAREVVEFAPGEHAGYGQSDFPDVVLGAPGGLGTSAGALDVLSLGVGGEIVLGFGERVIVDGQGPDFVVFENAFWPGDDPAAVFAEPGEVAVSEDGERWSTFPCDTSTEAELGRYPGCAGWSPTQQFDPFAWVPLDPKRTGGDAFDLADVGVGRARYVRIRDLSEAGDGTSAGFDLDAVGVIHADDDQL
ncbi:MAG: cell surface protein [Myxococcales bacterium]|jgi:hypothetical protein